MRAEQLLIGVSVYREPADSNAVVFHLGEHDWTAARAPDRPGPAPPYQPPPDIQDLLAACTASGMLHAVARGTTGAVESWQVDPWVAGELHQQLGAVGRAGVLVAAHRRAAEYWQWRAAAWPQDRRSDLHDLLEARHHLFLAADVEQASVVTEAVCAQLHAWGDLGREAKLIQSTLEMLPTRSVSRANWMHELGTIYQVRGEHGEAYRCYAGAVQMFAILGDYDGVARGQHSLGVLAQAQGDYRRAERHYKRSSAAERRRDSTGPHPEDGLAEPGGLNQGPVFKQTRPTLEPVSPIAMADVEHWPGNQPVLPSSTSVADPGLRGPSASPAVASPGQASRPQAPAAPAVTPASPPAVSAPRVPAPAPAASAERAPAARAAPAPAAPAAALAAPPPAVAAPGLAGAPEAAARQVTATTALTPDAAARTPAAVLQTRTAPRTRTGLRTRTAPRPEPRPPADARATALRHTRRVVSRRSVLLPAVIAVGLAGLFAAGLSAALARTAGQPAGPGPAGTPPAASATAVRAAAAGWVAAQVSRSAVVACDPAECAALHQRGLPAGDLLTLGPGGPADPLASDVIVVTTAVRAEFAARLAAVYAPDVLASFGTGAAAIQVRLVAADGTAAYLRAARADLVIRRRFGAELLRNQHLIVSSAARPELAAGRVDSRLLATLATLADIESLRVLTFGDAGPGASPDVPLRYAEIAAPAGAAGSWTRTALRFLAAQQDPFLPSLTALAHPAGSGRALLIEYPGPSPLGLLEASGVTPGA